MSGIDGKMMGLLESLLDAASRRQALISSNIANVDTPGYQTRDLDFDAAMEAADRRDQNAGFQLEQTAPGHVGPASNEVRFATYEIEPQGLPRRNDLNNVSIDREMLVLAKTSGRYSVAIELIRKRFALLKYAIMDGRSG